MVLPKFYKMYKVLCFSNNNQTLTSAGIYMTWKYCFTHSKQGRGDLEKKQHAKKILELEKILRSDTDLQYKISLLVQVANIFFQRNMLALTVQ